MRFIDLVILTSGLVGIIILLNSDNGLKFHKGFQYQFTSPSRQTYKVPPLIINGFSEHDKELVLIDEKNDGINYLKIIQLKDIHVSPSYLKEEFHSLPPKPLLEYKISDENSEKVIAIEYDEETKIFYIFLSTWRIKKLAYVRSMNSQNSRWRRSRFKAIPSIREVFTRELEFSSTYDSRTDYFIKNNIPFAAKILFLPNIRIHALDEDGILIITVQSANNGHYNYFAIECNKGDSRWSHTLFSYHFDEKNIIENSKYQLTKDLEHFGEYNWEIFAYDLLHHTKSDTFPHIYRHDNDLRVYVEDFKAYRKKKDNVQPQPQPATKSENSGTSENGQRPILEEPNDDEQDNDKNVLVVHHSKGIEVIHLYTGRTLTQINPLNHDTLYFTNSKLFSNSESSSSLKNKKYEENLDKASIHSIKFEIMKKDNCFIRLESGIPTNPHHLLSKDQEHSINVCKFPETFVQKFLNVPFLQEGGGVDKQIGGSGHHNHHKITKIVPPIMSQFNKYDNEVLVFANNGMVTSIHLEEERIPQNSGQSSESSGAKIEQEYYHVVDIHKKWQVMTNSKFIEKRSSFFELTTFHPESLPCGSSGVPDKFIIVTGEHHLTLLGLQSGTFIETIEFNGSPPIQPIIKEYDFSGNGYNDILIVSKRFITGYISIVTVGSSTLSFLVIIFGVVIGMMYLSTKIELNDPLYKKI